MKRARVDVKGRTAVITGAANGIGRALSEALWAQGCDLALIDIDKPALDALYADLRADRAGGLMTLHKADVADRQQMHATARAVAAQHAQVNLLINNAGIGYEGAFGQTSLETWDHVLGINLWGVIYGCHFFLPYLAKADMAHIVNMSSLFGYVGMPGQTAYCASKYAVQGLSDSLREELRATHVGLTVVNPSSVATNIMATSDGEDPELMSHLADWYADNAMAPELAAQRIVKAIRTRKPRLLIAPEAYLADYIKRIMPITGNKLVSDLVIRVLGLGHMRDKRSAQWRETMERGPS